MEDAAELLEHRIPDVLSTAGLPVRLAAEIDFLAGRIDHWCELSDQYTAAIAARSLALRGQHAEARAALSHFDGASATVADVAAAAWAASRSGGPAIVELLGRLREEASEFVHDAFPVGPRRMYTGMLLAAQGELRPAIDELTAAVAVGDSRAPFWGALARIELGRVLRTAEALPAADAPPAAPVLSAARTFFLAGGYRSLSERVEAASGAVTAVLELGPPSRVGFGIQPRADVRSSKGLHALAYLVEHHHRVVSAAELALVVDGGDASDFAAVAAEAWDSHEFDASVGESGDVAEALRALLCDESARSRISKLLRRTIAGLSSSHSLLAAHLDASIVTGFGCRYRPTGSAVSWSTGRRS